MAPPNPPKDPPDCKKLVPNQANWSHEEKVRLAAKAAEVKDNRDPGDYQKYFDSVVEPLNGLARSLQLGDVSFLLAQSAPESGWLNVENTWLKNLFGATMGGHDNLGFDSIQQCVDWWQCRYGPYVKGVKNLTDYIQGIKNSGYNIKDPVYFNKERWDKMMATVARFSMRCGYEKVEDNGTWILKKKG